MNKAKKQDHEKNLEIRQFDVPKMDFGASDSVTMIDWIEGPKTEPPFTAGLPKEELRKASDRSLVFSPYPCHSLGVDCGEMSEMNNPNVQNQERARSSTRPYFGKSEDTRGNTSG